MRLAPVMIILGILLLALIPHTVAENVGNKTVAVRELYFPGETVIVKANFLPERAYILDPGGNAHEIEFDGNLTAKFHLKKNVILGRYRVVADNVTAEFVVDSWSIRAEYVGRGILGKVGYYYVKPEFLEYVINNETGRTHIGENGSFEIPLKPGKYRVILKCGNAIERLRISPEFEIVVDGVVTGNGTATVLGRVLLDGEPVEANLSYWLDGGEVESTTVNGTFNLSITNVSGKLHLLAEVGELTAKKSLKIHAIKRVVEVGERYFVNDTVTVVTNFKPKKAVIVDPAGKKHKLKFNVEGTAYKAVFGLKKGVVLGNYTVLVDGIVKKFVVDFCSISAFFDGAIVGTVKCHSVRTEFVNYTISGGGYLKKGSAEVHNGNFTLPVDLPPGRYSAVVEYGNAKSTVNFTITLPVKDLYFLGEVVEIDLPPGAEGFVVTPDNRKLNFSDHISFTPDRVGRYEVVINGLSKTFVADDYRINASFRNSTIVGHVKWHYVAPESVEYTIQQMNVSGKVEVVNGGFKIPLTLPPDLYDISLKAGNAEIVLRIVAGINVPETAFVGERIRILSGFEPGVAYVKCGNETLNLSFHKNVTEFSVEHAGICTIYIDNVSRKITVDDYRITAKFENDTLAGKVDYHFIPPKFVEYTILPANVTDRIAVNGSFTLRPNLPPGNYTIILKCGNAITRLNFSIEGERKLEVEGNFHFVGEIVEVRANFLPKSALMELNNTTERVAFTETNGTWVYRFAPRNAGVYKIFADGVAVNFTVDDYSIEAHLHGRTVRGKVVWHYIMPEVAEYVILPDNKTGVINLKNGSFEFTLPDNASSVIIRCGNAEKVLRVLQISDQRVLKIAGRELTLNISIDKGVFENLEVKNDNVSMVIANLKPHSIVNITVDLPFTVPEGLHVYYWKVVGGRITPINYTLSEDRRSLTFTVQDGVVDEDGEANGVIVDPLVFYVPRFNVVREMNDSSGILHVYDLNGTKLYDVKVEVDRGKLSYLAFVDSANLPSKPAVFPFQLVKFRVENISVGDNVKVRITYPSFSPTDNGAKYYKFNPESLSWDEFHTQFENNTVILNLKDGGFGDEDSRANGVVEDDGGVGWAGYSGEYAAAICRDWKTNEVHTYWVYVPHGEKFTISLYDGDYFWFDLYYPDGTHYETSSAPSNGEWDNFTINTNNNFGWWKLKIQDDGWLYDNGNYYGLRVIGADEINIRVNESWTVNGEKFYGTPDSVILDVDDPQISKTMEFWVYTTGNFKIAVYDPDYYLNVLVSNENGNLVWSGYFSGNEVWATQEIQAEEGWYKILLTQTQDYDDYSVGGNHIRLAVNLADGLYFKPMKVPITGRVLEDLYPLGSNGGEDRGVANAIVAVFEDNGNGILDAGDRLIEANQTNSTGYYTLKVVKDFSKTYFVAVNSKTIRDVQFNEGYSPSYIWAEQTYQVEWDGSMWTLVKKFGGRDPEKSDNFGINYEHYVEINLENYSGQSIDFGFSFDVVVNTKDAKDEILKPIGEVFVVKDVGSSWKKVYLLNYYEHPVIVCTYNLPSSSDPPGVIRIRNVNSYSFEVRVQNPGDTYAPTPSDVHCIVMEEGKWVLEDGRKVEAYTVLSDNTNENNNWNSALMEHVGYKWSYSNPVVLGQVMSYNDSGWSVFWDCNGNRLNPPDSNNLYVGKHVGEDTDTTRASERIGYIVVEAGRGVVNGIKYSAQLGDDSIRGVGNNPPYSYDLGDTYSIGIVTQSAMDGGNGGWAILYGPNPVGSTINLAIDEDQISDDERWHTTEQVAYWVFSKSGILTAKIDSERYCQGCLRQFVLNSNAIAGKQRSYFVMMVEPNGSDADGRWWTISVNSSLGTLPAISDSTELNGTVFHDNMSVRDANPGYVCYNYSTGDLESYSTRVEIPVGVGMDGVPFSGDEARLKAVPKPEIEVYSNILGSVLSVEANDTVISGISVFGARTDYSGDYWNYGFGIKIGRADGVEGSNTLVKNVFAGLRANASDPANSGLNRNEYVGIVIYSNNTTVSDSVTAFNGATGVMFWGRGVRSGASVEVQSFENGQIRDVADGFAMEGWMGGGYDSRASNVTFERCLASKNAGYGVDSWFGREGLSVVNSTIELNGITSGELGGIRVLANNSILSRNMVRENNGSGIVIGRMANYSTHGNTLVGNSIFNNSWVGVDINPAPNYLMSNNGDNVTLNDGLLNCSQPNCGMDYPVITYAELDGDELHVKGYIGLPTGSSIFGGATVDVYLVKGDSGGDDLTGNNVSSTGHALDDSYGEGWLYLGSITADSSGRFDGVVEAGGAEYGALITATATLNGNTSEFGPDYLMVRKQINVSAGITAFWQQDHLNITINLHAYLNASNVAVYWVKPTNLSITSVTGDFDASGSSGNLYWWEFYRLNRSDTVYVYINLSPQGDFNIGDAYVIGVDPSKGI